MRLFVELKRVAQAMAAYPSQWAVCGGIAASIYREKARFTDDIDFALIDSDKISAFDLGTKIIQELGYKEYRGFIPSKNGQVFALLCARSGSDERFVGLDFILPVEFWVKDAVLYAQSNLIDFGFAMLPTITPECLLVAKIHSLSCSPERLQDLDDIQELIKMSNINIDFVRRQLSTYSVTIPLAVQKLIEPHKEGFQ